MGFGLEEDFELPFNYCHSFMVLLAGRGMILGSLKYIIIEESTRVHNVMDCAQHYIVTLDAK